MKLPMEYGLRLVDPPEQQLRDAMIANGITPPADIMLNGNFHRFSLNGHRDKSGWLLAFGDGIPAGKYGDFRQNKTFDWRADIGRTPTEKENVDHYIRMKKLQELRLQERAAVHEQAALEAGNIWSQGWNSDTHPYILRKKINPYHAKVHPDGRLMFPLFNDLGELTSIQFVSPDGEKRFLAGGAVKGGYCLLGGMPQNRLCIVEGYATGATVHAVTGLSVLVAYGANNVLSVAEYARRTYPAIPLTIIADNDVSQTGQQAASEAATATGATVITPPIPGMDANDYFNAGHDLAALLIGKDRTIYADLKTFCASDLPVAFTPPDELVQGFMCLGAMSVLYGDSNAGKTFFALSICVSVAAGEPFHGRQVDPGPVIYLASESPGGIKIRIQAVQKRFGHRLDNLYVVPVPLNFHENNGAHSADVINLIREIETKTNQKIKLVVGDTLSRMVAGASENTGEDMAPVMARFESIAKDTGAAVLVIHHTGKDAAKGSRGWSGIRAFIDTEIEVKETPEINTKTVTVTKQREMSGKGDQLFFWLEPIEMGPGKFGNTHSTCVAIPDVEPPKSEPKPDKKNAGRKKTYTIEALRKIRPEGVTTAAWFKICRDETGISRSSFYGIIGEENDAF